jgi:S1-C subfamily serine protease
MLRFFVSLAGASVWSSVALAAGPFGSIHVGLWNGGAFTNDTTGEFSHCSAAAGYNSGISVVIAQNATGAWLLGFASASWRLGAGQTFPMDVTFDGQAQFHLAGSVASPQLMTAVLPSSAIEQFRKSSLMIATVKDQTLQFSLTSTGQLLPVIANCVAKVKATGLANAGDFSAAPPKPPAAAVPAKSASAAPPAAAKATRSVEVNGTGFVISSAGHILTNNHVIADCVGDVHGNLTGESAVTLRVVSKDETNDLALLQAPSPLKAVAAIRRAPIHSGDAVVAIGFPYHGLLTSDFTVSTGIVNSLSGLLNDTRFLQISAPIQPGNSGGPLLDTSGNVVGVVAAKINAMKFAKATGDLPENINFAIKTGAVRDFLDNSVAPYEVGETGAELKTAQVATNARAYTLLLSCSANVEDTAKR